jgi:UDP-glucose 4-epimerase
MSNSSKVIILGHSGFIGSRLMYLLSRSGNIEVIGHSLPEIDLTNSNNVDKLVSNLNSDCTIVMLAAVKRQFGDNLEVFGKNMAIVRSFCHILENNPIKRLIFLSSAAVYGEETENKCINENSAINPTSYYGISKYSAECILRKICGVNQKTSLVCLRPPLVYGPGDAGMTYGPSGFTAAALQGVPITLWGDGLERREFIYIDDLCFVIENLLKSEFEGTLNVVSGESYCFTDIIDILKIGFANLEVNYQVRSKQKVDNTFDAYKMKSLLKPEFQFTSLSDGVSKIIDHV